ncbi:pyruvate/2-oxoglutarate dehydrogenase complex dihydrolipoamide dehydrogenase (E3) component [Mycetocola sp. CAN_C7]|uniref:dihydrolipoyl dehydrogenase family protein n=1 Tax=Mycetocola sp. CAN_C7 TaxID=2787724 RepID=UPI0018CB07ED
MPETDVWDLVVVGGGSAGLVASKTAAGLGARVLLIERDRLGGDCLWTGCVPSKALIAAAHSVSTARESARFGMEVSDSPADFGAIMASIHRAMDTIAPTDSPEALEAEGVNILLGNAVFTSPRSLTVDGADVHFRQAVIATGSAPAVPAIPGIETVSVLTSDNFWEVPGLPRRLVVLGGGPIGCELGQAMARLGSRVTIVQRGARILPKEEPRASNIIHDSMLRDGVTIRTGRTATEVRSTDGLSGQLCLDDGTWIEFDRIVAAVGREPRTGGLDLHHAGVKTGGDGYLAVDQRLRTANPRIWAAGDATGMPKFTHTAGVNGSIAATNAILGLRRSVENRAIPRVTFTSPEVAAVGLQPATADPGRHRVVTWEHTHSDRAVTESDTDGFTQIVVDRSGRILGGTVVGPRAGETIGELTLAVKRTLSTSALAGTTHPYPTFNDPLWNAAVSDVRQRLKGGPVGAAIRMLVRVRRFVVSRRDRGSPVGSGCESRR